jgi:hypothetical protein
MFSMCNTCIVILHISLRSKWRLTGFSRRFTPKNPVRLHTPFGELPRWGAKNVLPLNLMALLFTRQPTAACHVSTIIISCFCPAREYVAPKGECHPYPISRLFIHCKGSSAASRNVRSALEIHIHTALTVLLLSVRTFPSSLPLYTHMICSIAMQP